MYGGNGVARLVSKLFLSLTLFSGCSCSSESSGKTIAKYARFYEGGAIQCQFATNRCVAFDWKHISSIFKRGNNVKNLKVYKEISKLNNSYYEKFEEYYPSEFVQYLMDEHFKQYYSRIVFRAFKTEDLVIKADKMCYFFGHVLSAPDVYYEKCNATFSNAETTHSVYYDKDLGTFDVVKHLASPKVGELIASQKNDAYHVVEYFHPDRFKDAGPEIFNNEVLLSQCHISLKDFEKLDENHDFRKSVMHFLNSSLQETLEAEECSIVQSNVLDLNDDALIKRWMKNNKRFLQNFVGFLVNKTLPCLKLALGVGPSEDVHAALINFCREDHACYNDITDDAVDPLHLEYLIDKLVNLVIEKLGQPLANVVRGVCKKRETPPTLPFPDFPMLLTFSSMDEEEYEKLPGNSYVPKKLQKRVHVDTSSWRTVLHESTPHIVAFFAIAILVSIPFVMLG